MQESEKLVTALKSLRKYLSTTSEISPRANDVADLEARFKVIEDAARSLAASRDENETEKRRLAALVDSSPVGVMVVDASSRTLVSVNLEAQRILGMSPEPGSSLVQYHQTAIYRRVDGKKYEESERPLARSLDCGEVVRAEEILLTAPDGRTVTILVNATPIYSNEGDITAAAAVLQDMTPLEEMERLRNDFLAIVSHELRTPLTAIKGTAATVLSTSTPFSYVETRQFFRTVDQQADVLKWTLYKV